MLEGKKIILGITGGIAAYKMNALTRLLVKEGASVKIIMSPEAIQFVSPLVLSTLSNNQVLIHLHENNQWNNHIELATWADLMIIAPATANTLAKAAHGLSDSLLLATFLSKKTNIMFAPAMDEDMWLNPITQKNIDILKSLDHDILPVGEGFLASGIEGKGRMLEPEEIVLYVKENYGRTKSMSGKKILITAGPTQESIDPVRFISNHSSGKMGIALAETCYENGAEVTLILGPTHLKPIYKGIEVVSVVTAEEMKVACAIYFNEVNIIFMAAAVADYKPIVVKVDFDWFGRINSTNSTLRLNQVSSSSSRNVPLTGVAHSNFSYLIDTNKSFGFDEIFNFNYSEQCDRLPFFEIGQTIPFRVAKTNKIKNVTVEGNIVKKSNVTEIEGTDAYCELYIKDYENNLLNILNISGKLEGRSINIESEGILQSSLNITQRIAPLRNTL